MNKFVLGVVIAAIGCGCITINKNDGGNDIRRPAIARDIVHEKFQLGDKAVSAEDNINCLFDLFCWGSTATHIADAVSTCSGSSRSFLSYFSVNGVDISPASAVELVKNGAYANACDAAKCDQIVAAKYKVIVEDYFVFKHYKAEITGYPATLTGVELIENTKP